MTRPLEEMKEPLPPELKRTLDFCRCSSHCGVGSKLYFSFSCLSGGTLKSHIPSSAIAAAAKPIRQVIMIALSFREFVKAISIDQHRTPTRTRQLLCDWVIECVDVSDQTAKNRAARFHCGRCAEIRNDGVALFSGKTSKHYDRRPAGNPFLL